MKVLVKKMNTSIMALILVMVGMIPTKVSAQDADSFEVQVATAVANGVLESGLKGRELTRVLEEIVRAAVLIDPSAAASIAAAVAGVNPADAAKIAGAAASANPSAASAIQNAVTLVNQSASASIAVAVATAPPVPAGLQTSELTTNSTSVKAQVIINNYNANVAAATTAATTTCAGDSTCVANAVAAAKVAAAQQAAQQAGNGADVAQIVSIASSQSVTIPASGN